MGQAMGLALVVGSIADGSSNQSHEGAELIGTKAQQWDVIEWLNSKPLSLEELQGRTVLVRWWTGPECQYCALSAPHLNTWYERYHTNGLIVLGFYHHKSPEPLTQEHVERLVERYGFRFPVAVDPGWRTLRRWWLEGHERSWTSVSFLIDQEGIIRSVHPGGSYATAEAEEVESMIRALLDMPSR